MMRGSPGSIKMSRPTVYVDGSGRSARLRASGRLVAAVWGRSPTHPASRRSFGVFLGLARVCALVGEKKSLEISLFLYPYGVGGQYPQPQLGSFWA